MAKKVTIHSGNKKPISFTPGALHKNLHVKAGEKIPATKMQKALSGAAGPKARREALFAKNVLTGKRKK